jgi:hypothetical protein
MQIFCAIAAIASPPLVLFTPITREGV